MLLKFTEEKYLVNARIAECSSSLSSLSVGNIQPGWARKALEIEFVFKERQNGPRFPLNGLTPKKLSQIIKIPLNFTNKKKNENEELNASLISSRTRLEQPTF